MAIQTREQSTLVIATVLASASLLLLSIPLKDLTIKLYDIAPIGFFFGIIGLLYRQATVWTLDRIAYNRDVDFRRGDAIFWRNHRNVYYVYSSMREFLLIWFLTIPIVLWGLVWSSSSTQVQISQSYDVIVYSAFVGMGLTIIDYILRWYDRINHRY